MRAASAMPRPPRAHQIGREDWTEQLAGAPSGRGGLRSGRARCAERGGRCVRAALAMPRPPLAHRMDIFAGLTAVGAAGCGLGLLGGLFCMGEGDLISPAHIRADIDGLRSCLPERHLGESFWVCLARLMWVPFCVSYNSSGQPEDRDIHLLGMTCRTLWWKVGHRKGPNRLGPQGLVD